MGGSQQIHRHSSSPPIPPIKETFGSQRVRPARIYRYLASLSTCLRAWIKGHDQSELLTEARPNSTRDNSKSERKAYISNVSRFPDLGILDVSFDGDQDPMCPRSMPPFRKWIVVIIVCTGTLCVTCASSIYTTTYEQMNPEMSVSPIVATSGLSLFVLGIGLGPLLTGPLSEWYGRRPVYLISWSWFILWNIATAVAKNIQTILIARFLAGFAGGTFLAVSGGTVSDVFPRHQIQMPMTLVSSAPFIGPCLGPLIGGFISYNADWRWNYYFVIIWSAIIFLAIIFFAPETHHSVRLKAKAAMLRKQTGNSRHKASCEINKTSIWRALAFSLVRPFQLLFLETMCLALDLFSAILLGMLYLFFQSIPHLFETTYGFNLWQGGLAFLGVILGMVVAAASGPLWPYVKGRLLASGKATDESAPEFCLIPAIPGGVLIPIGLFWFGWTMQPHIHWMVPIIGSAFFGCGMSLAFTGIFTFLVAVYPQYAASALAGNGFVRCSFAAAFPLFGTQMYNNLGCNWATSLLAFLTIATMPLPMAFFCYGKKLRAKSRFALTT